MKRLRHPISGLRGSPYPRTAALLGLTSGGSLRFVHTFDAARFFFACH